MVRSRLRYALPAAAVALRPFALLGGGEAAAAGAAPGLPAAPRGLPMLLAPAVTIAFFLARRHLLEGLLAGIAAGLANLHSWGLLVMALLAVFAGYGRRSGS